MDVWTRVCVCNARAVGPSTSGTQAHESMYRCQLLCRSPAGPLLAARAPWQLALIHIASPVLMWCGTARLAGHPLPCVRRTRRRICDAHGRHVWGARVSRKCPSQSTSAGASLRRTDPCMSVRQASTFSEIPGTLPCPLRSRRITPTCAASMALGPAHCTDNPTQRSIPPACEQRACAEDGKLRARVGSSHST